MTLARSATLPQPSQAGTRIVELRQYLLHPGQRDVLIELFEREFIETQEALGITVVGEFRDLDRPDYFVWLRGYPDMQTRGKALPAFYDGPVWRAHNKAANATMIDSDNVLLLEPASKNTAIALRGERPAPGEPAADDGHLIVATIYYPKAGSMSGFAAFFAQSVRPVIVASGATVLGEYVSSAQANNFPRLPVREHDHVFVWFGRFKGAPAYAAFRGARWPGDLSEALESRLDRAPETLRLSPGARSRL